VALFRVRGDQERQRVARRRQPEPGKRTQMGGKDDRFRIDVVAEFGRGVPDVRRVLVVEADVDVRPLPRVAAGGTRWRRRRPELDSVTARVRHVIRLQSGQGSLQQCLSLNKVVETQVYEQQLKIIVN